MNKKIDYFSIIQKYFEPGSRAEMIYVAHVTQVTQYALKIGKKRALSSGDMQFLEEAAMLHDIGISQVNAPRINCHGKAEYIEHGYLGRNILEDEGFPEHALVCERHTGSGLSKDEIASQALPLPNRDMLPQTQIEKIICYADLFHSKSPETLFIMKDLEDVENMLKRFSIETIQRFNNLHLKFGEK